mmetsp:Transcript_4799/g.9318  ORF Transcript_4799/g.9318 Transcript_4799/m.9318 type:complete len:86 (+) Transcript_4799:242-499(+)
MCRSPRTGTTKEYGSEGRMVPTVDAFTSPFAPSSSSSREANRTVFAVATRERDDAGRTKAWVERLDQARSADSKQVWATTIVQRL